MSARPRQPITDAEWRERFDPEGVFQEKMLDILQEIKDELAYRNELPAPRVSPTVYQPPSSLDPKTLPL